MFSTSSHKPGIQESMFSVSNTFIQSGYIGSLLPMVQKPTPVRASLLSLPAFKLIGYLLPPTSWPGAQLDARYTETKIPRYPSQPWQSSAGSTRYPRFYSPTSALTESAPSLSRFLGSCCLPWLPAELFFTTELTATHLSCPPSAQPPQDQDLLEISSPTAIKQAQTQETQFHCPH